MGPGTFPILQEAWCSWVQANVLLPTSASLRSQESTSLLVLVSCTWRSASRT
jgi:hypothetical protein